MVHVATYLAYLKGKGPGLVASAISGVCLVHAILSFERKGKMQATKDAAASMKESAANAMASAKSGMDKTKATAREKMETVSTHDPVQKQMAKEKKQEKIHDAEAHKQEVRQHNAAAKQNAHSD